MNKHFSSSAFSENIQIENFSEEPTRVSKMYSNGNFIEISHLIRIQDSHDGWIKIQVEK